MGSRKLYDEFATTADKFNTLKFIDFDNSDLFQKTFLKNDKELESIFEENNGIIIILRK